ncbi:MAG: hypothetical protein JRG71_06935 [Deltaproteobacteria bacterium]|nr:hypothetical protein [Deltaproteobacteria bacterium]
MAFTAAQRQAKYRENRPTAGDNGERRLSTWLSTAAFMALKRLAAHNDTTQRDMIERLILEADQDVIDSLRSNDEELNRYIG